MQKRESLAPRLSLFRRSAMRFDCLPPLPTGEAACEAYRSFKNVAGATPSPLAIATTFRNPTFLVPRSASASKSYGYRPSQPPHLGRPSIPDTVAPTLPFHFSLPESVKGPLLRWRPMYPNGLIQPDCLFDAQLLGCVLHNTSRIPLAIPARGKHEDRREWTSA